MGRNQLLCIETVLKIAMEAGNCLAEHWGGVLALLSKLDYLYNIRSTKMEHSPLLLRQAEFLFPHLEHAQIDKIFNSSVRLDAEAILQFIVQLIALSDQELSAERPRLFAVQRLVEMTDLNMHRIKIIWSRIWTLIKEHFNKVPSRTHTHF